MRFLNEFQDAKIQGTCIPHLAQIPGTCEVDKYLLPAWHKDLYKFP